MSHTDTDPSGSSAELERLRVENEQLRSQLTDTHGHGGARRWSSILLAFVAAILVPISVVTIWTQAIVLDTDQYVETVAPLVDDEAVQQRISDVVTEQINEAVDFTEVIEENLPEELSALSGALSGGAETLVARAVDEIVKSDAFATVWEEANRAGHEVVVAVLSGEGSDNVDTSDGRIVITFDGLIDQVSESLTGLLGEDITASLPLDEVDTEFVLMESDDLASAQDMVQLIDTLSWLLPLGTLLLLAAVVLLANDRRRGFRRVGLALVLSSIVTFILLAIMRGRVVSAGADVDATGAVFDTVTRFLSQGLRVALTVGVIALIGAWLAGPSRSACKVGAWWNAMLGKASTVDDASEVGRFPIAVAGNRRALEIGAITIGSVVLVLWTRPTGWVVVLLVLATGLVVSIIEVLARIGAQAAVAPDTTVAAESADPVGSPATTGSSDAAGSPVTTGAAVTAGSSDADDSAASVDSPGT